MNATVVIPTLNRPVELVQVVRAVLRQLKRGDTCIVVAQGDNKERDSTIAALSEEILKEKDESGEGEPLLILEQPVPNRSEARNLGLVEATTPYVVFLDDDAIPRTGWLAAILEPLDGGETDLVAGRLYEQPDQTTNSPRLHGAYLTWTGHTRRNYNSDRSGDSKLAPSGNMAVRRQLALQAGGFDPRFGEPSMYEDVEFSERLRRMGGKVWYCGEAVVDHLAVRTGGWWEEDPIGMEARRATHMSHLFRLHRPLVWPVMAVSYLGAAKWKVLCGNLPFRAIWRVAKALLSGWDRGADRLPPLEDRISIS